MNWSIIALEVTFALIAAVLSILSHETFKLVKHLVFGKPLWVSVFFSTVFFGSDVKIFQEFAFEYKWAGV